MVFGGQLRKISVTGSKPYSAELSATGSYIPSNIEYQTNAKMQEGKYHTISAVKFFSHSLFVRSVRDILF
jgi:hypothetical protein